MSAYDVIYYWTGGREEGEWRAAIHQSEGMPDESIRRIERMGYVAHRGQRSIGPPEGPPCESDFQHVGM